MAARNVQEKVEARRARLARHAAEEDPQVVLAAAGRYLEARQRSVAEVRRHLEQAGYAAALVEAAVDRLVELGILEDRAFARAWLESRDRAHPRGETALRRELGLKGIERETIAEVLAERAAGLDEYGEPLPPDERGDESVDLRSALALLARKGAALRRVPDARTRRQRAYALLARSGFDPGVCRAAAARLDEPTETDDEDDLLGDD
jgi:regulatory protein